jgi:hypothetical protein
MVNFYDIYGFKIPDHIDKHVLFVTVLAYNIIETQPTHKLMCVNLLADCEKERWEYQTIRQSDHTLTCVVAGSGVARLGELWVVRIQYIN